MKKISPKILVGCLVLVLLLEIGGAVYCINSILPKTSQVEASELPSTATELFGVEAQDGIFREVPAMTGKEIEFVPMGDVGGGDYQIRAEKTTREEYDQYLALLEENGFEKKLDNGENGIEGFIYSSWYQKGSCLLIVSYMKNISRTTITATTDLSLSDHLQYDASFVAGNREGAKTTFHLEEQSTWISGAGGSLIQLKNGHFLIFDGGHQEELPILIEYLESLTPDGEKPVIEGWFISHSHGDHLGVLREFFEEESYADRIYIDGIYFNIPGEDATRVIGGVEHLGGSVTVTRAAAACLTAENGEQTKHYQNRIGDRYYFDDITIDVIGAEELLPYEQWDTWNSTSTILMCTIDGQKVLLPADADYLEQMEMLKMFDKSYFTLTLYQAPHHGGNVFDEVTYYFQSIETVIYPHPYTIRVDNSDYAMLARRIQNQHLQDAAKESVAWGDGTKIFTFPYEAGQVRSLPVKYNHDPEVKP